MPLGYGRLRLRFRDVTSIGTQIARIALKTRQSAYRLQLDVAAAITTGHMTKLRVVDYFVSKF